MNRSADPRPVAVAPDPPSRRAGVLAALALSASALFGFGSEVTAPRQGIDPSYVYAVHQASAEGLVWGRQFMATFGFLGYVLYPLSVGDFPARWLAFQALLVLGVGLLAWAYVRETPLVRTRLALPSVVAVAYAVHVQELEQRWLGLVLLLALVARDRRGPAGGALLALAGGLSGVLALVKLSLGAGAVLTALLCALATPGGASLRRPAGVGAAAAAGVLGTWWAHYGSLDGLAHWCSVALSVGSGYDSAMSVDPRSGKGAVVVGFVAALLLVAAGAAAAAAARRTRALPTFLLCLLPLVLAWKHSVVRLEQVHVRVFPLFLLFVGLLVALTAARPAPRGRAPAGPAPASPAPVGLAPWPPSRTLWPASLLAAGVALGLGLFVFYYEHLDLKPDPPGATLLQPLRLPGLRGAAALLAPDAERARLAAAAERGLAPLVLPARLADLVRGSADVYPWEACYFAANALPWRQRPSPASFASYTPQLDRMNASFFAAPDRPAYLLWHLTSDYGGGVESIDQRHVFWDEPATLSAILAHYDLAASQPDLLLLRARSTPRRQQRTPLGSTRAAWGTRIALPATDAAVIAEITLPRPPRARLRRLLYREEPAYITVEYTTGEGLAFRFVPDQAGTGLWLSPLPRSGAELASLLSGGPAPRVAAIVLHGNRPAASGPPANLRWWAVR